jgi:hypothetical protein
VSVEQRERTLAAVQPTPTPPGRIGEVLRNPRAPIVSIAAVAAIAFALLMYLGRGIGFYFDEWNFVLDRHGHSLDVFLKPHNEHIALVPVVVYKALLGTAGMSHHWPYLAVLAVMHTLLGVAVYLMARPRIGAWAAVLVATLLLFAGVAWQNMIWAFQIGFVGSLLGGAWAWVALDRGGRRADIVACGALLFATASSSLGVPMALGVTAELVVTRRIRALWVPLLPLALYGIWYVGYGVSTITGDGIMHAAPWAMSAVATAAGGLFGLGPTWGDALAILLVVALGWRLAGAPPTPRLVGVLVAGTSFWALTGAARSVAQPPVPPDQSRYITFGALVIALAAVELVPRAVALPRLLALGAGITLLAVALGLPALRDNALGLRAFSGTTAAELGAMQLVPGSAPPGYQPDPQNPQLVAGPYFAAARKYGSAGDSPSELPAAFSAERVQADRVLQQLVARLSPTEAGSAGTPPAIEHATGERAPGRGGCELVRPASGVPAAVTLVVPKAGLVLRALGRNGVQVRLRRFADSFANGPIGNVAPAEPQALRLPADASSQPYHVQLAGPSGLAVCSI